LRKLVVADAGLYLASCVDQLQELVPGYVDDVEVEIHVTADQVEVSENSIQCPLPLY
jgi:hypothetical protein